MLEYKLLSKVLDTGDFMVLYKYNINELDFSEGREAYLFIKEYWAEHKAVPSPSAVASEADFDYINTVDQLGYLCKTLKEQTAKRMAFEVLQNQASSKFSDLDGNEFVFWLKGELEAIQNQTAISMGNGTNYATNGDERWKWYKEAEENHGAVSIPTPYPSLTDALAGGNDLGDYVLLMSYSNQGKSWIASQFGLTAWEAGFGVLHYSPEMNKRQTLQRLDTLHGHFSNLHLMCGGLYQKEEYKTFLERFNGDNNTPYIVKTMEDLHQGLTVEAIEADLHNNPDIKMVIVDGFNLMAHHGRDSNRNNMGSTSRQLRQLFGRYNVVGIVVHQTPTSAQKEIGDLMAEDNFPIAPSLTQYSETVAVIQDASTVLTFAFRDGKGKLAIRKARKPCVDFEINLQINYDLGYLTEVLEPAHTEDIAGGDETVF